MSHFVEEHYFHDDFQYDLVENDFKIAFAIQGFQTKDLKDDPRYVKWIFRIYGKKDEVEYEEILPYHKCTESDYAQFYPINKDQKRVLDTVKSNPENGFLCVDFDETNHQVIFGREEDADYQRLEAILAPCNYKHNNLSDNGDKVSP